MPANEETLKKQYLKLAKVYHPDNNKGSKVKFQELQEAYDKIRESMAPKSDGAGPEEMSAEDIEEMLRKHREAKERREWQET